MKKACEALRASCTESLQAHDDLSASLNSVKKLVGKPTQGSSSKGLKRIGVALLLAPSPEPFTDIVGIALIGVGAAAERHKPPLTISELCIEGSSIVKGISTSRPLGKFF